MIMLKEPEVEESALETETKILTQYVIKDVGPDHSDIERTSMIAMAALLNFAGANSTNYVGDLRKSTRSYSPREQTVEGVIISTDTAKIRGQYVPFDFAPITEAMPYH